MDRLIKIDGSNQVVVRIEPGQRCYGVLTLSNVMYTMPVAFRLLPLCRSRFAIRPHTGIIAPLGSIKVEITYLPPPSPAPILPETLPESDDSFFLDSVVCAGAGATSKDGAVPNDWFCNKKKQVFTDSALRIFYVGSAVLARLVEEGNMEKIREVLEYSDPQWRAADSCDDQGRNLLHLAIARGRADLVQLLLEFGADLEATNRAGRSPLEAASAAGETLIGELLLAKGASTGRSPKSDLGPLHYAAAGGHAELLRLLLLKGEEAGALTADGRTALHLAAAEQRQECAEVLMAAGARTEIAGKDGNTPLHAAAAAAGDEAVVKLLMAGGCAGILEARNRSGKTACDLATEGGKEKQRRVLELVRSGENLMAAARKGDVKALMREIELGGAVDGRDGSGWTALMMAAFKGRVEVIKLLLEKGAQIDGRDDEGYTALHCAAEGGQSEVVELLVKRRADLEVRTAKGRTAMEIAGELGFTGIVRIFVQGGAAGSRETVVRVSMEHKKAGKEKEMGEKRKGSRGNAGGKGLRPGFTEPTVAAVAVAGY